MTKATNSELLKTEDLTFLARRADGSECEVRPQFHVDASGAFCDLLWKVVWEPWRPEGGLDAALQTLERDGEIAVDDLDARKKDGRRTDICEAVCVRDPSELRRLWAEGFRPS